LNIGIERLELVADCAEHQQYRAHSGAPEDET
jgi:hypothetical protein